MQTQFQRCAAAAAVFLLLGSPAAGAAVSAQGAGSSRLTAAPAQAPASSGAAQGASQAVPSQTSGSAAAPASPAASQTASAEAQIAPASQGAASSPESAATQASAAADPQAASGGAQKIPYTVPEVSLQNCADKKLLDAVLERVKQAEQKDDLSRQNLMQLRDFTSQCLAVLRNQK